MTDITTIRANTEIITCLNRALQVTEDGPVTQNSLSHPNFSSNSMQNNGVTSQPEAPQPVLIYVAGLAYSGTTLFASTLGHSDNIFNGGEINYSENDYHHEKYCSCGQKIDNCALWKPMLHSLAEQEASGAKTLNFSEDQRLRPIDSRSRSIWQKVLLVAGVSPEKIFGTPEIKDYVQRHTNFFRTLATQSNSKFIVDASKSFARLDVIAKYCDLPIYVIFLKRSTLQSYASRLKRAKKRNKFYMQIFSPIYLFMIILTNIAINKNLKSIPKNNIIFINYEDFVINPESIEKKLTRFIKTDVDFGIKNNEVSIGHLHIFTGNIWLSKALKEGQTVVPLQLGDGQSSLSWFEKSVFQLFSPISSFLDKRLG